MDIMAKTDKVKNILYWRLIYYISQSYSSQKVFITELLILSNFFYGFQNS